MRHPRVNFTGYLLLFGKGGLLEERRLLDEVRQKGTSQWVVREITRLSDYRRHELPEGGELWFPWRAVCHFYSGALPDGRLVEWQTQTINIKDLRFNVDISDEQFALEFPADIRVFDGMTGQETWLEPGVRPTTVMHPEVHERQRRWWIGGASLTGLALLGALVLYARRKWRAARTAA